MNSHQYLMQKIQNKYQERLWALQKSIFHCSGLIEYSTTAGSCHEFLHDDVIANQLGPDSIIVGETYGKIEDFPRILFIGDNPNSTSADFGTLHSIQEVYDENWMTTISAHKFYSDFFDGSPDFDGFNTFNIYKDGWCIQRVLSGLFPQFDPYDLAQSFAMTNSVLCKGRGDRGNPSIHLRRQCMNKHSWLRKTIELLQPEIIFIFSVSQDNSAWSEFTIENKLIEGKEPTIEKTQFSYFSIIQTPKGEIRPLTFGIPHFAISNFSAKIFDGLFEGGEEDRFSHFIDILRKSIQNNLGKM